MRANFNTLVNFTHGRTLTYEDGLMNLDIIEAKIESDLMNTDGFPFYLSKEEIKTLAGILSDSEKRRQIIGIIDQIMQSDDQEMVDNHGGI